jgi:hypothetical protein
MGHGDPRPGGNFFCLRGTGSFERQLLFIPQHAHHISVLNQEQERVRHYTIRNIYVRTFIYVFSIYF